MNEYDLQTSTLLCEIIEQKGSDKGGKDLEKTWHNYTPVYFKLFENIRFEKIKIFELGLGTNNVNIPSNMGRNGNPGASLYAWSEFFPNAEIYGADIDKDILFKYERISTFYCDQTRPEEIKKMWSSPELYGQFHIIIDDGLHDFKSNICFFENSIHKLSRGGFYIIEDIWNHQVPLFEEQIKIYENKFNNLTFELLRLPSSVNKNDNNLLICRKPF